MNPNQFNPYQSPLTGPTREWTGSGIWRDKNRLVLWVPQPTLVNACVKTGEKNDLEHVSLKLEYVPAGAAWMIVFGALGYLLAKSVAGTKIEIVAPVSKRWMASRRYWQWFWGFGIGFGVLLLFSGFVLMANKDNLGESIQLAAVAAATLGLFGALFSLFALLIVCRPILKIEKVKDVHAWVSGAHPAYLALIEEVPIVH